MCSSIMKGKVGISSHRRTLKFRPSIFHFGNFLSKSAQMMTLAASQNGIAVEKKC